MAAGRRAPSPAWGGGGRGPAQLVMAEAAVKVEECGFPGRGRSPSESWHPTAQCTVRGGKMKGGGWEGQEGWALRTLSVLTEATHEPKSNRNLGAGPCR